MNSADWEKLENEIAECTLAQLVPLPEAIGTVCKENRSLSAKLLLLATISVVSNSDEFFVPKSTEERLLSSERYKVIAALAADVVVLQGADATCGDLCAFWNATGDRYFQVGKA